MKLTIPANWQDDFFDKIDFSSVSEVYGKLPGDVVGGGRPSFNFTRVSGRRLKEHITEIRQRGMHFNYLLNATCIDNLELTRSVNKKIRRLLDDLVSVGVDTVTVGLPYLLKLVKRNYPTLKVAVTTNDMVDNLTRVKYWEEHGADQITLSYTDVNRDFDELKLIAEHAECDIKLICNLFCRRHCPFQMLHANFQSHASQIGHVNKRLPLDYYSLFCLSRVFSDPLEIMRSCWIRPEDLHIYEEIGIDRFKLVERGMNTPDLARVVNAYTCRRYDGNFADLLPSMSKYKYLSDPRWSHFGRYLFKPRRIRLKKVLPLLRELQGLAGREGFFRSLGVYVDNTALDGFLDHFRENNCRDTTCEECRWCDDWAEKAVSVIGEEGDRQAVSGLMNRILDSMVSGEIF